MGTRPETLVLSPKVPGMWAQGGTWLREPWLPCNGLTLSFCGFTAFLVSGLFNKRSSLKGMFGGAQVPLSALLWTLISMRDRAHLMSAAGRPAHRTHHSA